jgi:hypothetical protein
MNNYIDKYGRCHHKAVTDKNPVPSNNGWIYTAYMEKGGESLDYDKLKQCFDECNQEGVLRRHPPEVTSAVPISRDEILGMASLGFLKEEHLKGWNFSPYPIPAFDLVETIKQFWEIRDKHRNYLWQNNMIHTYRFAFTVPLVDRHFILSKWNKFNLFYWAVAKLDSLVFNPENGIGWLKYGGEDRKEIMKLEFPADHPLQKV